MFDTDGSGYITVDGIRNVCRAMSIEVPDEDSMTSFRIPYLGIANILTNVCINIKFLHS